MTQWRDIPGYEGYYQVSDGGQVRSLDRVVVREDGRLGRVQQRQRGHLKHQSVSGRHLCVGLARDGKTTVVRTHRLVLGAFVGPCPEGMECCHNDGNPQNNNLSNLRWDTPSSNVLDQVRHGTHQEARRSHCKNGHQFTSENTYPMRGGGRGCRACKRIRGRGAI